MWLKLLPGLPVVTYDTGGSPESINDSCGVVVKQHDISGLLKAISRSEQFSRSDCIERSKSFDRNHSFDEYLDIYDGLIKRSCE